MPFTSRLCFVQTDININQKEMWNDVIRVSSFGCLVMVKDAMGTAEWMTKGGDG